MHCSFPGHLPSSSDKEVLSTSKRALTIPFHFPPASGVELKHRLSLNASETGLRHAFIAAPIRVISCSIDKTLSSTSSGLSLSNQNLNLRPNRVYTPRLALQRRVDNVVDDTVTRGYDLISLYEELTHVRQHTGGDVQVDLKIIRALCSGRRHRVTCSIKSMP